MRKFSRCILILLVVSIIAGIGGYMYEKGQISPVYSSTAQLYVVPGEENEASIRASNGGLNNDFMIIFTSNVVISDAQKTLGTTEDISKYLTVSSPANSNIVELKCVNVDQDTAKSYVDAIAQTAIKTTSIIPVKSIQILSEGTSTNEAIRPDLYKKTGYIVGIAAAICIVLEMIILLIINAFKKPVDNSDDELEYERHYGKYAQDDDELENSANGKSSKKGNKQSKRNKKAEKKQMSEKKKKEKFLDGFDPDNSDFFSDYTANNEKLNKLDDVFKDTAAGVDIDKQATKVIDIKAVKEELSKQQASDNNVESNATKEDTAKETVSEKPQATVEKDVVKSVKEIQEVADTLFEQSEEQVTNVQPEKENASTENTVNSNDEKPLEEVVNSDKDKLLEQSIQNVIESIVEQSMEDAKSTVTEADTLDNAQLDKKAASAKTDTSEKQTDNSIESAVDSIVENISSEAVNSSELENVSEGISETVSENSTENVINDELDKEVVDNFGESEDILADIESQDKVEDILAYIEKESQEEDILADIENESQEDILADIASGIKGDILDDIEDDIFEKEEKEDEPDIDIVVLGRIQK